MGVNVKIQGPYGAYKVNETMRGLLEANGMSLVIPGDVNAAAFLDKIVGILPELKNSGVHERGFFVWERLGTVIIWGVTARVEAENECMAIFVSASMEDDQLPRMFIELQDSARAVGLVPGGVFNGEAAPETAARLEGATVIPAQLLLGIPWEGD